MKGKKFGINPNLSRGITETINAVKNNTSTGRYEVIALSRFELDPKNPRELVITLEDIRDGLQTTDPLYATKKDEFEKLSRLGDTIKKKGLINAVVAYKRVDKYRLVAGERRLLACVLIGKEDIQAKVFDEEPPEEDLRMIQWIENQEREDLTLKERLGNIKAILAGVQKKHPFEEMTPTILKDLLSISLPQASNYLALLNASRDLQERIEAGKINNIEKGAFLSRIEDQVTREKLIKECESGASLRELQSMLSLSNKLKMDLKRTPVPKRVGKPLSRINLGVTRNPDVVKVVVESVVKRPEFQKYAPFFDKIYWEKFEEASLAFKKMVELLENENAKN